MANRQFVGQDLLFVVGVLAFGLGSSVIAAGLHAPDGIATRSQAEAVTAASRGASLRLMPSMPFAAANASMPTAEDRGDPFDTGARPARHAPSPRSAGDRSPEAVGINIVGGDPRRFLLETRTSLHQRNLPRANKAEGGGRW